jgi:hypothetical protein
MRKASSSLAVAALCVVSATCIDTRDDAKAPTSSVFTVTDAPVATIAFIGADTLSDSARIYQLQPEPDGGSIAFLFADPAKGITRGLGIVQASGSQAAQLGWPDSVVSVWWSNPHQLSFTAGTGRGVRLVVDAHAAQLQAVEVTGPQGANTARSSSVDSPSSAKALSRARSFIDSIRVQPAGTPQHSALQYRADSVLVAQGDSLAAVHVSAADAHGTKVNPSWYLVHLPSGHVHAVDSLTGQSPGLAASAGQWGANGLFYYAKERSIWRAQPVAQ